MRRRMFCWLLSVGDLPMDVVGCSACVRMSLESSRLCTASAARSGADRRFPAGRFSDARRRCRRSSAETSSVTRADRNPGIAFGSVKSQAFSASPTKSRIAGSAVHARRSAARVKSAGTPARRNARMSVPAVIEFDRRQGSRDRTRLLRLRRGWSGASACARGVGAQPSSCWPRALVLGASLLAARPAREEIFARSFVVLVHQPRAAPALRDRRGRACA